MAAKSIKIAKQQTGTVWIGTSGIVLPGPKATFPREYHLESRMRYYSSLFNSLEINSSFYKIPLRATFEKWSLDVPNDFCFTIKLWREITHSKELRYDPGHIDTFLTAAAGLGTKKGCLLVQFPGKINLDYYSQVEQLLEQLHQSENLDGWRIAVEFRNPGWYIGETHELMNEFGSSLVLHDNPKASNMNPNKGTGTVYLRLHGPTGNYRGSYTSEELGEKNALIRNWVQQGRDVFVYFNNTAGAAFENAQSLRRMLL